MHVCIVVENLPVPFDRRVWLESCALRDAGYEVSVVCPKASKGDPTYEIIDRIHVYKYPAFPPIQRSWQFIVEYLYAVTASLIQVLRARKRHRIDAIQLCNPPDVLWLVAAPLVFFSRIPMVYDQHDLCPELFESRFGRSNGIVPWALRLNERITYRLARHVIATNGSYRHVALQRGRKSPDEVTIVRSGPSVDKLRRVPEDPSLRGGFRHLIAYLGVMGPQDGVENAIRAMAHIRGHLGRHDVKLTLMGDGDAAKDQRRLARDLGLDQCVEFTGRVPDEFVARLLSTAEVGLSPDPKNPLNDVSTMNKTMEYMAYELPVVAFDLVETRVSAADAAVYAQPDDVSLFAEAIVELLDDEVRRKDMGVKGRSRVETELGWHVWKPAYVAVYHQLLVA